MSTIAQKFLNNPLFRYLKESRQELKKVVWPTRALVMKHTFIVIIMSLITALFLGALDDLFSYIIKIIVK